MHAVMSPVRSPMAEEAGGPPAEAAPPAEAPPAPVTLEFAIPDDLPARLGRLPFIQAYRTGRGRGSAVRLVWSDTADGVLAAQDLLYETPAKGPPVLRHLLPLPDAAWHPGMTAGAQAPQDEAAVPLAALAAFEGRRQVIGLALPEGRVELAVLAGRLRSVIAERMVARLTLAGDPAAVVAAARALAASLPLAPPLATLAEQARALASGTAARAHRLGPPDTSAAASTEDAFVMAVGHLLEVLHQQGARIRHDAGPEAVHQSRVALRRLRSLLRVFRRATDDPALRSLDARLREVVATLGPARDWDVFLAGIGGEVAEAFPEDARVAALLRAGEARRRAGYDAAVAMVASPGWRLLMIDALAVLLARPWRLGADETRAAMLDLPARAFGRAVLDRRWDRLRRAGAEFDTLSAEELHELRLDGKRLRYAAEVFAPLFDGGRARRFLRRLATLQDGLGIANDVAVARGLARSLAARGAGRSWAVGVVEGWCEARVAAHRDDARGAWRRLGGKDRFWTAD
jgi:CHAD domain-containing protein